MSISRPAEKSWLAAAILVGVKTYLTAAQVAELAELLEDAPRRVGVIDQVLEAAAQGRGMTLLLQQTCTAPSDSRHRAEQPGSMLDRDK